VKSLLRNLVSGLRTDAAKEPFGVKGAVAYSIDELALRRKRQGSGTSVMPDAAPLVAQLRDAGFAQVANFLSTDQIAEFQEALQVAIQNNPQWVNPATPYDLRLHGAENVDARFKWFSDHPLLNEVARTYLEMPARVAFTLGAALQSVPGNPGSGGGWHRDSYGRQFKTMVYLTDVGEDSGPFQIVERSHHFAKVIGDNTKMAQAYGNSRLSHEQVMELLKTTGEARLHTLSGSAGTLLLFDSSTIHRGMPIRTGERMALTNYFYPEADIDQGLYEHFRPVAGHTTPRD
jgi:ectoine hydroxylase-related dioxygenase (phytanoyl-CoA dioxygenase family)